MPVWPYFFGREWTEFILGCFQNSSASTMKQKELAATSSALTSSLLGNRLCFRFKWIGYPQLCHLIGADAAGATQAKGMPFGARFFLFGLGKPVMASGSKLSHVESASSEKRSRGCFGYNYKVLYCPIKHVVILKIAWPWFQDPTKPTKIWNSRCKCQVSQSRDYQLVGGHPTTFERVTCSPCQKGHQQKCQVVMFFFPHLGGPLLVISRVITSINGLITGFAWGFHPTARPGLPKQGQKRPPPFNSEVPSVRGGFRDDDMIWYGNMKGAAILVSGGEIVVLGGKGFLKMLRWWENISVRSECRMSFVRLQPDSPFMMWLVLLPTWHS